MHGVPAFPGQAPRSLALMFGIAGVLFLLGGLVQINPIWLWGPYHVSLDERRAAGLVPRLADRRPSARAEPRRRRSAGTRSSRTRSGAARCSRSSCSDSSTSGRGSSGGSRRHCVPQPARAPARQPPAHGDRRGRSSPGCCSCSSRIRRPRLRPASTSRTRRRSGRTASSSWVLPLVALRPWRTGCATSSSRASGWSATATRPRLRRDWSACALAQTYGSRRRELTRTYSSASFAGKSTVGTSASAGSICSATTSRIVDDE